MGAEKIKLMYSGNDMKAGSPRGSSGSICSQKPWEGQSHVDREPFAHNTGLCGTTRPHPHMLRGEKSDIEAQVSRTQGK